GPDGKEVEAGSIVLGRSGVDGDNPLELERSFWWLLHLLATQLILVALPEEYFYRGYVQPTLARTTEQRESGWLGTMFSRSVVWTSVLFSLGHFLIDWRVSRLAVFFPSLVFGAARRKTQGLMAPIVYHG